MIKNFFKSSIKNWIHLVRSFFLSTGSFFLILEAYEVLTNLDAPISFSIFILVSILLSICFFIFDGFLISGFYINKVELFKERFGMKVVVKIGDIFEKNGWRVIGVNDFFDSKVDNKVISASTLHGLVINKYWENNVEEFDSKIFKALSGIESKKVERVNGKKYRYPIGTAANIICEDEKFLFVALAETSIQNGVTVSSAENIICATRGAMREARIICANNSLIIPLLGSGLARAGLSNMVLLDLILCGIFEELKLGKITEEIIIFIHPDKRDDFDFISIKKKWK
jgi:hypothetical protein